ncbi:uncharacterized protein LOC141719757 [Apium graveolens]|uniref:uncharacterized protein LOC141719757 n=1 Tax=Apium graveolens TaxID=4045 RepID=UPI003D78E80B
MFLAVSAKNKLGFVAGKFQILGETSPYFAHWQHYNDMVITWILNSIVPEIHSSLVYITLSTDVWSDIHVRFSKSNGPRFFELKKTLSILTQDTLTISSYYTKFKMLWDDLLNASSVPMCVCTCSCKAKQQLETHDESYLIFDGIK